MAGSITVSSITLDSDNNFSIKSNTGATLFFANTSGVDIANSIGATAITNDKILSVANTKISGNIISSQITSNPTLYGNVTVSGTGYIQIPSGTTAERPTSTANGQIRYNTTAGGLEIFTNGSWIKPAYQYPISYMIVSGGGAGGRGNNTEGGGGGGAGGLVYGTSSVTSLQQFTVTIGAGGAGTAFPAGNGLRGGNSSISSISTISVGGGGGLGGAGPAPEAPGGSGGGGGSATGTGNLNGSGTPGQGNAGGTGGMGPQLYSSGGGGGAGAVGTNGVSGQSGPGGTGVAYSLSGSSVTYAGGGGGGGGGSAPFSRPGAGGSGGGGGGGGDYPGPAVAVAGTTNTGGGGGGATGPAPTSPGASGGSGIVVIVYPGTNQLGTGGTVTSAGGNTVHTFTSSGTFTA